MYSLIKNNNLYKPISIFIVVITMIGISFLISPDNAYFIGIILILLFIVSISLFRDYIHVDKNAQSQKRVDNPLLRELEVLKRENIVIAKELSFLKNQFNAHILFNFLNFCYSKVHKNSKSAADAIEAFSDMLRYSLQIKADEPVSLKKEIEYLENYICIQKCLTSKVCINFQYEGAISGKFILPGILVTFVENAFKYGEINNELHPIEVNLFVDAHQLIFTVKNRKNAAKLLEVLDSNHQMIKEMLDSFYGDRYKLTIKDVGFDYFSELVL